VRSRTALIWLLVLAVAAALGSDRFGGGGDEGAGAKRPARVVGVVDGDTIKVRLDGRVERVRYIGVDTPESVKPDTPVQCYAKAASAFNERLVEDRAVRLVVGREPRDRYGRLLAYVYRGSLFVNAELVRRGYAKTLTIPPNDRFAGDFRHLQTEARRAGRGLWSAC
jgi:micrococcal nuclease